MKASLKQHFVANENLDDDLFYNALAEELNKIIEEELNKNYEDINAEIIDDCCLALNEIYELQNGVTENVTNIEAIIKKYKLQRRKKLVVSAACAAVAAFAAGTTFFTLGNETVIIEGGIIENAVGKFEEIFKGEEPSAEEFTIPEITTEEPTLPETTEPITQPSTEAPVTRATNEIKNITVYPPAGFYSRFESLDDINLKSFYISVNYANGEKTVVPISEGRYEICKPQADGTTEIKIYYKDAATSYYVTVIPEEKLNPVIVTSIYGTFANKYTVDEMSVIAVFSDGTEKWIPKSECTITTEDFSDGDETGVIVTVEYEGCSFQFLSE